MRLRRFVVLSIFTIAVSGFAQQAQKDAVPRWTVLTDPVCPVGGYWATRPANATERLRVMYFPGAKGAKIKDPQALTLKVGFNEPEMRSSATVPFARSGDHWEASLDLARRQTIYVIFSVREDKTGMVDDNSGRFWDVVFCNPTGAKDANSLLIQAKSYTGVNWPLGVSRPKDYNQAIAAIERAQVQYGQVDFGMEQLWNYKVQRDGGDAAAWAKVTIEIEQYFVDHPDRSSPVGNFLVEHEDKLPADFVERMLTKVDEKKIDPRYSYRASVEYDRAARQRDAHGRLAAYEAFIAKHPDTYMTTLAQNGRFYAYVELGDLDGSAKAFADYLEARRLHPNDFPDGNLHNTYLSLARLYIDKGVKLDAALKLIEEGRESLKTNPAFKQSPAPDGVQRSVEAQCALLRARAYLALREPALGLPEAQKALELSKGPEGHFVLAQVWAAGGDQKKALDEYFEAVLLPSNEDLKYGAELQRFYLRQHFGNARQFEAELQRRKAQRFLDSKYVPILVDREAPAFEFSSFKGEKFTAEALKAQTVVVNFWSPG